MLIGLISASALFIGLFLVLLGLMYRLRPQALTDSERKKIRIHPDIPSQFKTYEGIEIHYHQLGEGPDLVLLHGIGASTFIFRDLIIPLSKRFRVTAIDMPGFGLSQKDLHFGYRLDEMTDYLSRFLTSINVECFSLVGSSMGGSIGLWIARRSRHRCTKLITIAASTHRKLIRHPVAVMELFSPLHFLVNRITIKRALANLTITPSIITAAMIDGYLTPFKDHGEAWSCFLKSTRIIDDHRMPEELAELNLRSEFQHLMIYGEKDKVVPLWVQEELHRVLPRSEFKILKDLGHHPFEEDPQLLINLIQNFLLQK